MKYRRMTQEQKDFILKWYKLKPTNEISEVIGVNQSTITTFASRNGLYAKKSYYVTSNIVPKKISYPTYTPGQWIKIRTKLGEREHEKKTRSAVVLEVYPKFLVLSVDGICPGVKLRYCVDKYDILTNKDLVI